MTEIKILVPDIVCCRCGATAPQVPTMLRRVGSGGDVVDSVGNQWQPQGSTLPAGWVAAPRVPGVVRWRNWEILRQPEGGMICASCAPVVADALNELLAGRDLVPAPTRPANASPIPSPPTATAPAARVINTAQHVQPNRVQPNAAPAPAGSTIVRVRSDLPAPLAQKVTVQPTVEPLNQSKKLQVPSFAGGPAVEE